ncbi:sterol O-acyltransferase 1 isoform X1 [Camponotus floridanus]|uniref:sterol O-acyltransferase 1 isoform X1 n=1 Tax=Camponotus floridanus TaxID=104421 RepID=UPI000DC69B37|nr:sterol O-acyltransferase 1 isoform X1 [Camponotus floridanus]
MIMGSISEDANDVRKTSSEEINTDVANGFRKKVVNGNADILRETTTDGLRKSMQEIRKDVLEQVNDRINDNMISKALQGLETSRMKKSLFDTDKYRDKRQSDKEGALPDKEFLARNSLLTDLFEITHIRTVYNLFIVIFLLLFLNTIAYDIMESGTLTCGIVIISKAFAKFPASLYIWSLMQISTLAVYVPFNLWSHQRLQFSPKSLYRKLWDYGWLTIFISYQVLFLILPPRVTLNEDLGIACRLAIFLEQTRMMMKSHAFVRSVAPRFISYKPHSDVSKPNGPGFSQYLYFLFAPTLVYRDEYPRTDAIRWIVVVKNFMEVVLVIFYFAFIMERLVLPVFHIFGTQYLEPKWIVKSIIEASVPGILLCISANYLLLHSWMNAWAEMLQFADRLFYKDWWNSTSYRTYYRTWNVVVHDWLYTYIYKDIYEILMPRNKTLATLIVFLVSAIFHEYTIALGFGFFYPMMFFMFAGVGLSLFFVGRIVASNVVVWLSFCIGNGIMLSTYAMEYYARLNCPPYSNYYLDLFAPRSWTCQAQFIHH